VLIAVQKTAVVSAECKRSAVVCGHEEWTGDEVSPSADRTFRRRALERLIDVLMMMVLNTRLMEWGMHIQAGVIGLVVVVSGSQLKELVGCPGCMPGPSESESSGVSNQTQLPDTHAARN